jgi:outer membrane protein OmpA-like peptidoglycan-associated protein
MFSKISKSMSRFAALAILALAPVTLVAQVVPAVKGTSHGDTTPKWDIFMGYSYLSPLATVTSTSTYTYPNVTASYDPVNVGEIVSISYYIDRYFGLQVETGIHEWGTTNSNPVGGPGTQGNNDGFTTAAGGVVVRYPTGAFTPFAHMLFGDAMVDGPIRNPDTWGPAFTIGGGMDYRVSHHFSIRFFQIDSEYMRINFGSTVTGPTSINAARVSAGAVLNFGSIETPVPVTLSCSANPVSIFAGDPVTVTATAGGLNPRLNAVYTFSGNGVTGNGTTATVATGLLTPSSYTVKCGVKEGKPGKEGLKPRESAEASASFTVKPFEPPTLTCSASPDTIKPGDTSTITAAGISPQNRPLTYSYSASSGAIRGTGASGTFDSTGAPTGVAAITCNVSDDKGQTATANTSVTITAPPPVQPLESAATVEAKQLEMRLALHSVFFPTDQPRVEKPNGGLLASQDKTLTNLATDFKRYLELKPDAYLTLTGHADIRGSVEYNKALSERRVNRTKLFLVGQGVPEAKIQTSGLGKEHNLTAAQVKELIEQNPDLNATERGKVLHNLGVIVWAQNRRVDVTLSTTGQQSVRMYPFNASDSLTLIDQRNLTQKKKAAAGAVQKPVPPIKK